MSILTQLQPVLKRLGVSVELRWFESAATPCPCTSNLWNHYNPEWHLANPTATDCNGTGKLQSVSSTTVTAVALPKYSMSGEDAMWLPAGSLPDWDWVLITQDMSPATECIVTDDLKFFVVGEYPYFLEGNKTTPTIRVLLLSKSPKVARVSA